MESESTRIEQALNNALKTEQEGKAFYLKASEGSANKLVKDLFRELAEEEDAHARRFQEICKALKQKHNWPNEMLFTPEKGKRLKSLFARAARKLGTKVEIARSELEAIEIALEMEMKSYELYRSLADNSKVRAEREFYEALAGEEQQHRLTLLDSREYLSDPAGWFTKREHWSLDGI
jgi:rubrerythrin